MASSRGQRNQHPVLMTAAALAVVVANIGFAGFWEVARGSYATMLQDVSVALPWVTRLALTAVWPGVFIATSLVALCVGLWALRRARYIVAAVACLAASLTPAAGSALFVLGMRLALTPLAK